MKMKPLSVIADDLTGSCEIAGVGFRFGLDSIVSTETPSSSDEADLLVYDTETRLDSDGVASAKLSGLIPTLLPKRNQRIFFKKVDSVFRGPIAAEINLMAEKLGFDQVLLVAANPAMGRTISNGFYSINGTPLHETGFAQDVHHPAKSSWVSNLLGVSSKLPVHRVSPGNPLPEYGLILGDAEEVEDFAVWANQLSEDTLLAGAAAFFEGILKHGLGLESRKLNPPVLNGNPLLVSGTTSPAQRQQIFESPTLDQIGQLRNIDRMNEDHCLKWVSDIEKTVTEQGRCIISTKEERVPMPRHANAVRDALAFVTANLVNRGIIQHVVVEGGSTAAAIASQLGWTRLKVVHEWAPGIVSLASTEFRDVMFTLKPGSYPWPKEFRELFYVR